jgi:hypothetical protein
MVREGVCMLCCVNPTEMECPHVATSHAKEKRRSIEAPNELQGMAGSNAILPTMRAPTRMSAGPVA